MRKRSMRAFAGVLVLAALLAACGSDDGDDAADPAAPPAAESPVSEAGTVVVADSDLGSILVDADGMTLYLFEADSEGSSTCYDDCASTWPALIATSPPAGEGIDDSLLGTTERTDGGTQVTYAGHPLYRFASDEAAGDTNGQGMGEVWFVVDAAGAPVEQEAARPGPGY